MPISLSVFYAYVTRTYLKIRPSMFCSYCLCCLTIYIIHINIFSKNSSGLHKIMKRVSCDRRSKFVEACSNFSKRNNLYLLVILRLARSATLHQCCYYLISHWLCYRIRIINWCSEMYSYLRNYFTFYIQSNNVHYFIMITEDTNLSKNVTVEVYVSNNKVY